MTTSTPHTSIDIGILGADGRMGAAIIHALADEPHVRLCAAVTAPTSPHLGQDASEFAGLKPTGITLTHDIDAGVAACDVLIDFSHPDATLKAVHAMQDARCQTLVSGTTGYSLEEDQTLRDTAQAITFLKSGNFSLGINVLEVLVEQAAKALREGWDIEILDMHHKHKIDAPSGTALMLGAAAARGRGVNLADVQTLSRSGRGAARMEGEIGFAAMRGGSVIGAHDVKLASELEMITLSHTAFDRSVFASGAVKAALWAHAQPPGLYDMKDVLGL